MAKVGKKEQVPLTEWLESAVQDPSKAPAVLRPHLQNLQAEAPEPIEILVPLIVVSKGHQRSL